jgi:hypothetical protein
VKGQAQCRATLEALAEIKNPGPVAFVEQANITNGAQQVKNGMQPSRGCAPWVRWTTTPAARWYRCKGEILIPS